MKFFRDLIYAAVFLLAAALVLEYGLRGAGERFQASFYLPERERGYALRPGAEGWNVSEHENYVRINSKGQHDCEHDFVRPPNTIRIAILGDSVTEAMQVPLEKAYFSILERELNAALARTGQKVEVVSFGVGGYGLGPQYLTMKQEIWKYDPQIVMTAAPIDGMILRSSRHLYPGDSFGAPFFTVRDGNLQLDPQSEEKREKFMAPGPRYAWSADLMNQSRLLSLFNSARAKVNNDVHQWKAAFRPKAEGASTLPSDYWLTYPFLGPANPELTEAFETAQALLLSMRDEASRHHAEFWIFVLDMPPQVDPDPMEIFKFQKRVGVETLFRTDHLICDFAAKSGIPHMALAPELARFAAEQSVVLHGFKGMPRNTGHLNEIGQAVAGRIIAQELRENSEVLSKAGLSKTTAAKN